MNTIQRKSNIILSELKEYYQNYIFTRIEAPVSALKLIPVYFLISS